MESEQIIGRRWRVLRLIGKGGMGSVYEVEHVDLGTVFAVKQLKLELAADELMVRSFVREARRLVLLGKQSGDQAVRHIVQVEDLETDDVFGRYIRMELIRGDNLSRYRAQHGAFSFPEVVRIGSEIAMALGLAHRNNLIHCDVKPANILVEEVTGRAVVTDFGISKRMRSASNDETAPTTSIGGLTTRYAAPEQVRGDDIDQRTDLYALGGVLYEMASGRRFIDELKDDIPIAVKKAASGWRPSLPFTQPVPAKFIALLEDLLENACDKRVADAAQVIERLQECLEEFKSGENVVVDDATVRIMPTPPPIPTRLPVEDVAPTVLEEDRERLEELHQELESDLEAIVSLEQAARVVGVADETWPGLVVELRSGVEDVVALARRGNVSVALERGGAIAERLMELQREQTAALHQRIELLIGDVDGQWQRLRQNAGTLLSPSLAVAMTDSVQAARAALEAQQWAQTWELVQRSQQALEAAHQGARSQADAALQERNAQLTAAAREWQDLQDLDGAASPVVVADVEGQLAALSQSGHFVDAVGIVDNAVQNLRSAVTERKRALSTRVAARREQTILRLQQIDEVLARQIVPHDFERAQQTLADAAAAEQRSEWRAAEEQYSVAEQQLGGVGSRIEEWEAAQVRDLVHDVQTLTQQAAAAAEPIVGPARDAAQQVLAQLPPRPSDARAQLSSAKAALGIRLAEAAEYALALVDKQAAEAAQQRVAPLPATPVERRDGDNVMRVAAELWTQRRWKEAQEAYRQSATTWTQIEQAALQREARVRELGKQRELEELLRNGDADVEQLERLASIIGGAPDASAETRNQWRDIHQLAESGDIDAALERARRTGVQLRETSTAQAQLLRTRCEEELTELRSELADLSRRAGALLAAAEASTVTDLIDSVSQLLNAGDLLRAWNELSPARDALDAASTATRSKAQQALQDHKADLEASASQWQRLGGADLPVDVHATLTQAATSVDEGQFGAAVTELAAAVERMHAAVTERQRTLTRQVAEARAEAQARRDAVDEKLAATIAPAEIEDARRQWASAEAAEQLGDLLDAEAAYHQASESFAVATALFEAWQEERAAALSIDVTNLLEESDGLDDVLAAAARQGGRDALDAARGSAHQALNKLESAAAGLTEVLSQAGDFAAANEQRQKAQEAQRRVSSLSPRRGDRRTADRAMKSAAAAFIERQWSSAQSKYEAATSAWIEAEKNVGKGGIPWVAVGGGGAALVGLAALVLYFASPSTAPRPQPAPPIHPQAIPVAPAPPSIVSVDPDSSTAVALSEDESRSFSIKVAGNATEAKARWLLDDKQVASNTLDWRYAPGADAGRAEPHTLRVAVGKGDSEKQSREWKIQVSDVNHPPIKRGVSPADSAVSAEVGKRVTFSVDATDPDGDNLKYAWTVDGKSAGSNSPSFDWQVAGNAQVAVAVDDGKIEKPVMQTWQLASLPGALPTPLFDLVALPQKLASLKFQSTQSFEVKTPAGIDPKQIAYLWTVNGEKVADAPSFQFTADDPQLAGTKPVTVLVNAHDDKGHAFKHDWQFKVIPPPPPRIASVIPPVDQPLKVNPGNTSHFELAMAPAATGQTFGYVFSSNGKETRSSTPRYELTPEAGREYTIVAHATDNFGQLSDRKTWKLSLSMPTVVPPSLPGPTVETWLDAYRQALVQKNVDKLQDLLQLSAAKASDLQKALSAQCDLNVDFKGTKVEQLAPDQYRARYERVDRFTDCNTSQPISKSTSIEQTFRISNGKVELEKTR